MSFALDGDVCILGAGAIGLCHLLLLKHAGARHVHMVEPLEERCLAMPRTSENLLVCVMPWPA